MVFRAFDSLQIFNVVAKSLSFTIAAGELNLTKGAVSYQIKKLEQNLGFKLFNREQGGVSLTDKGKQLLQTSNLAFNQVETEVAKLKNQDQQNITVGMSTYFASRWLMPRLMDFTASHPKISLRIQPMIDLTNLESSEVDLAIRWGNGSWLDMTIEKLFSCPAIATAGKVINNRIKRSGLEAELKKITLLHDRDDSEAWRDWHGKANFEFSDNRTDLVILDPNVRVEAVINGQGIALNDFLVNNEIEKGLLFQISPVKLDNYGYYLAYRDKTMDTDALATFRDWITNQAE